MKTESCFLILLILGSIASCENTFEDAVRQAKCTLQEGPDAQCKTHSTKIPQEIKVRDEEANANPILVCRDVDFIVLAYNPGTYVIQRRLSVNDTWSDAVTAYGTKVSLHYLLVKTRYQFRLHRVFEDGISRPEITEWFETMSDLDEPMKVPSIAQPEFELEPGKPLLVRSQLSFNPAEDRVCFYEVLCWDSRNRHILIELDRPVDFNVTFIELEFEVEYTIMIKAKTKRGMPSHNAQLTFVTPSCLDFHSNLTICAPSIVRGLEATAIHKVRNIFDVNVTWSMPEFVPDLYNVWLEPINADTTGPERQNVSGTNTETIFSNVKIVEQYDVHISALSQGGRGEAIYKRFRIPLENFTQTATSIYPNVGTSVSMIVMTFLASVVLIVGTGIFAYHRHEKRKRNRERLEYFKGLEEKEAALDTIKDVEDPDPITTTRSLLTPVDEYEINPDCLEIKRVLGSGAFGVVKLGSLRDDRGHVTDVAVKMLRDDPNEEDLRGFELEIKMMKSAGQHPNIVSLLGCCTIGPRPLLIVEYCSRGDLQSFLRAILEKATVSVIEMNNLSEPSPYSPGYNKIFEDNSKHRFSASLSSNDEAQISSFVANRAYDIDREAFRDTDMVTVTDLLNFGRQIATGMEFLSSNRVVHRDLAARNVLVCDDRTVKISDFGLSRDIYQENVYKKQGNGRVPVKWMAIEALTHQVYSTYSDVWSFGILLWEIVTLGSSPYPDIPANGVLKRLRMGYRMERPSNCSVPLYNVMLSCWQTKPRDRPTFTILRQELDKLICMAAENEYLDLNDVSKGTSSEDEDSRISSSRYTYLPQQLRYVNDHEPRVIYEEQE